MEIDRLVFSENEIGETGRSALASKLVSLADRVDTDRGESKFLRLEAGELKELAKRIRRIPEGGPVPASLRDQWMRIRSNIFDDRWWFARSAADLPAVETSTMQVPAEPTSIPMEGPVYKAGDGLVTILEGRWATVAISMNGRPATDPEISGSWWVFQGGELLVYSRSNSEEPVGRYRIQIVIDAQGHALRTESLPGNERHESGWMIYELNGNELRVAFFDGLRERPEGFDAPPNQEPELVVVTLQRG